MVHPIYPILGGLALGLAVFAAPEAGAASQGGSAAEYSGLTESGLASRDASTVSREGGKRSQVTQAGPPLEDGGSEDARKKLRRELERIRQQSAFETGASSFTPPMPVKKRPAQAAMEAGAAARHGYQGTGAADPQIERLVGQLLLMNFRGAEPSDAGPRAIRTLLQSGLIAGAVFGRGNIQSKAQLKELMKFFSPGGAQRPILAIHEIGGGSGALPHVRDFEQWPSEKDVAAKGDPQYAYSTYRSMGSSLSVFGFNVNFGPVLAASGDGRDPGTSFGGNPLQTGVFAKTFVLGHREEKVVAVPIVDGSSHSVRALKTLLVSDPGIPISSIVNDGGGEAPFTAYEGLVRGARFCFTAFAAGDEGAGALSGFKQGCDFLILDGGVESPAAVREQVGMSLSQAIRAGELTRDVLDGATQRAGEFRSMAQRDWPATAAHSP